MQHVSHTMLWHRLDGQGAEFCTLRVVGTGALFDGTVTLVLEGQPALVHYQIACNPAWETRSVTVEMLLGLERRWLQMTVVEDRRWWLWGIEADVEALRGCFDIDLSITPATNSLPIRRLNLAIGESHEIVAAWVRFPDLTIQPLPQKYTRLAQTRYRYESGNGAFSAEIEVDDLGLVRRYEGGWVCQAAT